MRSLKLLRLMRPTTRAVAAHGCYAFQGVSRSQPLRMPLSRSFSFSPRIQSARTFSTSTESVRVIDSVEDYQQIVQTEAGKLVVAYHTAAWCGPCKMIWPVVSELAEKNPGSCFLKIDVDEAPELAASNNISAMPTFLFLKNGKTVDLLVGADPNKLSELVAKHA